MSLQIHLDQKVITINEVKIDFNQNNVINIIEKLFIKEQYFYEYKRELTYLNNAVDLKISFDQKIKILILFQEPDFFDKNLMYSKVLKRFIKKYTLETADMQVRHPTQVMLNNNKSAWSCFEFSYDQKQGDISLEITVSPNNFIRVLGSYYTLNRA